MQQHFDLIPHPVPGGIIYQRPKDGYINATAMCQAASKQFKHWNENKTTREFLSALEAAAGIPTTELVQSIQGGDPRLQGTWVHPQVAINLGQWVSPAFAVQVSQWVYDWMSGSAPASVADVVPYHLRRYVANQQNVPVAHFSVLTEMTQLLIAPMEIMGYTLPERLLPDISQGRMYCKWLRSRHGIDTDSLPNYAHVYEDGRRVAAKASGTTAARFPAALSKRMAAESRDPILQVSRQRSSSIPSEVDRGYQKTKLTRHCAARLCAGRQFS